MQLLREEISRLENHYAQSFARSRRKELLQLKLEMDAYKTELRELAVLQPSGETKLPVFTGEKTTVQVVTENASADKQLN
jgi:hypothetical protein